MTDDRRRFGFWAAVGSLRVRDLVSVESVSGTLLGLGLGIFMWHERGIADRVDLAGDFLALVPALLGVVFAGFALVVSILSDAYIRLLATAPSGIVGFLRPFMLAIGLQVSVLMGAVLYRAAAPDVAPTVEPWLFGALSVGFACALLDLVALARSVLMHGVTRAKQVEVNDIAEQSARRTRNAR